MNLDDLAPAGAGSLRAPVTGPRGQVVAQFTVPATPHPDELWEHGTRTTDATRGGSQGEPFGRPGHGLEHEPVDASERAAQHTAQDAGDFHAAAARIRGALRPGTA